MPRVNGSGSADPIVTADTRSEMADRLVRYLNGNQPNTVDHPRWDSAFLDVGAVAAQWELSSVDLTRNKTTITWVYTPEAGNPDDCGPWRIEYDGQLATNDYSFRFKTGPNVADRINEESTAYRPESLDVVVPPRPSTNAISGRAAQIAAKIADSPCDPWGHQEVSHPDPSVDTFDGREVESFLERARKDIVSESIESTPDREFMLSKIGDMLRRVARLEKQEMDRFEAATIQRALERSGRRISTEFDNANAPLFDAIGDVAEAVVDGDTHPAEFTDDALDDLISFASTQGFNDVASEDIDRFGT
jgi:hypothetical protein